MNIISRTESSADIGSALKKAVGEINRELEKVDGKITKAHADVLVGPSGGYVTVSMAVSGDSPCKKSVIGINLGGKNLEISMRKATEKLNKALAEKDGDVVDVFTKSISAPITGRMYTTIIAAVNEREFMHATNATLRRRRLKTIIELLKSDPKSINISEVAEIFGVSRVIIYKDLEEMGFKRSRGV